MRVLILNYEFPPVGGGAGRASFHLCRELGDMGHDVDAVVSTGSGEGETTLGRARVISVPTRRKSPHETGATAMIEYLVRAFPLARRMMGENRYDIVHYFFSVPTGLLSKALPGDVPYLVSLRGGDVPGFNPGQFELAHRLLGPVNRSIWRGAAAVVANSAALASAARVIEPGLAVDVVPNGVDTNAFRSITDRQRGPGLRLLTVSRLIPLKGIATLLEALALLPGHQLDIAGTGPEGTPLRRKASALEIDSRVHFLGAVEHDQLPDVYGRADLFVLPSMAEAMPHVVAEAMASGLPVVATRVGGIPELLRVPEGGEFVPPGNAAALARAIGRLTADPDSLMRMGAFNRDDAVTRLSWRSAAEKYAALYARCRIGRAR